MWPKHGKYYGSRKGAAIVNFHKKGYPGCPKSELLGSILVTLGVSGPTLCDFGRTVRRCSERVTTNTVFQEKGTPRALPSVSRQQRRGDTGN